MIVVHQSMIHNLLPKNYYRESSITPVAAKLLHSVTADQFGKQSYKSNHMGQNIFLSICTPQFSTKQLNHAYLAWQKFVAKFTFVKLLLCQSLTCLLLPKVRNGFLVPQLYNVTPHFLILSQKFHFHLATVFCCYAKDSWFSLPVHPLRDAPNRSLNQLTIYMHYLKWNEIRGPYRKSWATIFCKVTFSLLTNQIHHLNLHNFLYFST